MLGLISIMNAELSNFDTCAQNVAKSVDLSKESGALYLVMRSKVKDTGKCYSWKFSSSSNNITVSQSVQVMGSTTSQSFQLTINKNSTYDIVSTGELMNILENDMKNLKIKI